MSLYAVIHLRHDEVEAVFVFPDREAAVTRGVEYALRSGFFDPEEPGLDEAVQTEKWSLRRHDVLEAEPPMDDVLVIKRVFTVTGSVGVLTAERVPE